MEMTTIIFLLFILLLSISLGFELVSKVPSILHTPLMSATNAIHGITLIGAITLAGMIPQEPFWSGVFAVAAVALATVNVIGGYLVTERMLEMFKSKTDETKKSVGGKT